MVLIVLQAGAALLIAAALYAVWRSLFGDRSGPGEGDGARAQEPRAERPAHTYGRSPEAVLPPAADPGDTPVRANITPFPRREPRFVLESAARPGPHDLSTAHAAVGGIAVLRPDSGAAVANEVMLLRPEPGAEVVNEVMLLRQEPSAAVANEVMLLRQERDVALARGEALWELVVQLRGEVDRLRAAAERSGRAHLAVVPRDPSA